MYKVSWDRVYCGGAQNTPSQNMTIRDQNILSQTRCWWLTPIILATWETEISRITVQGQPKQIVLKTSSLNNYSKMDRRCGSSSRAPALWAWSLKFKPQSHQEKKKSHTKICLLGILLFLRWLFWETAGIGVDMSVIKPRSRSSSHWMNWIGKPILRNKCRR
jgi:hypothetical protein